MLKRELDQMKRREGELRDQALQNKVGVPRLTTVLSLAVYLTSACPPPASPYGGAQLDDEERT